MPAVHPAPIDAPRSSPEGRLSTCQTRTVGAAEVVVVRVWVWAVGKGKGSAPNLQRTGDGSGRGCTDAPLSRWTKPPGAMPLSAEPRRSLPLPNKEVGWRVVEPTTPPAILGSGRACRRGCSLSRQIRKRAGVSSSSSPSLILPN